ncbi:MAG: ABC transporter permease subunit [Planctomycetes bacterium]|nr:ABC transporter permease subunit [Planctomycetota bacterium]
MIGALLRRQVRLLGRLLAITFAGLAGFEFLAIHVAEAFEKGPGLAQLFRMLPQVVQDVVTSQVGPVSFPALVAAAFLDPVPYAACIGVIVLVATLPAGERESGLLDLFLARPLSRRRYLLACLLLVALVACVLPLALLLGAALGLARVEMTDELPWTRYAPCALGLSALLLALGAITLLLAVESRRRGQAVARAVALVLALYLLDASSKFWPALADWGVLSPFRWFVPVRSAMEGTWPLREVSVLLAVALVASAIALWRFDARDLD